MEHQRSVGITLIALTTLWLSTAAAEVVEPPADIDFSRYAQKTGVPSSAVEEAAMAGWLAGLMQACGGKHDIWTPLFHAFMTAQRRVGLSDNQVDSLRIYFDVHRDRSASNVVRSDCTEDLAQLLLDSASSRIRAWESPSE